MNSQMRLIHTAAENPASSSLKATNTSISTPNTMMAWTNWSHPREKRSNTSILTRPAARNITKNSIPPLQKTRSGRSDTI